MRRALIVVIVLALAGCAGIIDPPPRCAWQSFNRCGTAGPLIPQPLEEIP